VFVSCELLVSVVVAVPTRLVISNGSYQTALRMSAAMCRSTERASSACSTSARRVSSVNKCR